MRQIHPYNLTYENIWQSLEEFEKFDETRMRCLDLCELQYGMESGNGLFWS